MEDEVITAPQEEGVGTETPSQETPLEKSAEPQVPVTDKVEVSKPENQVQTVSRPRPSEFYGFRKKIGSLEETLRQQNQTMQEMAAYIKSLKSPDAVQDSKFDKDVFFTDPEQILSAREKALRDEIESLRNEIGSFKERQSVSERAKSEQEALEQLFPKTSPESEETLEERMENQQERVDKLMRLLKSKPALDMLFKLDPKEAVALITERLDGQVQPKSPTVLPKKLMGGAKSGGVSQSTNPKDQKRAELKRLMDEMSRNEELRFDEKHKERRENLIRDLERLEKE